MKVFCPCFQQGLNYIAGLLLLVTKSEDTSFWLLKGLVERIVPNYYTRTMDGVITDIDVLDELIRCDRLLYHGSISSSIIFLGILFEVKKECPVWRLCPAICLSVF
jgi:hypothetical protein